MFVFSSETMLYIILATISYISMVNAGIVAVTVVLHISRMCLCSQVGKRWFR